MQNQEIIALFNPVYTSEMEAVALEIMRSGQIASGPIIGEFERALGRHIDRDHVVSTSDMTSAIVIALRLSGVKPGDSVATLAFSCLSTNSAISIVGAKPLWIDIDPSKMAMCPNDLARKLTSETKAVLLYHVAGYPAEVDKIKAICDAAGISLIEDCNNSLGAQFNNQPIGKAGRFAVYSFYPNRQINGIEGGALICPDPDTAIHARKLRRFGVDYTNFRDQRGEINPKSDIPEIGFSAALNQLNAAIAYCQLSTLAERQAQVWSNVEKLSLLLRNGSDIRIVEAVNGADPAYWCFLILSDRRDQLLLSLKKQGVQCSILHHRNDSYSGFGGKSVDLPGTAYAAEHVLALPCGWWLKPGQADKIASAVVA